MGNLSLNLVMKILNIFIWFSFLFCSNDKTFRCMAEFPWINFIMYVNQFQIILLCIV